MKRELVLILGGVRSGKSRFAQQLASSSKGRVLFLATAQATDDEMAERIAKHKSSRPATWRTVEEPLQIASALKSHAASSDIVILDCLTVWLGNMMSQDASASEEEALEEVERLLEVYKTGSASLILVSGEVGMGLVPPYPLGRAFRDIQGRINQKLAQEADKVFFMIAGIPLELKAPGAPSTQ